MKKNILVILIGLSVFTIGRSQSIFKIGPSILVNFAEDFEVFVESTIGAELSFETGIKSKMSFHIGTTYHYGKYKKKNILLDPKINQFWGLDTEFRYHFKERYHSQYLGLGFDIKSYTSENFFDNMGFSNDLAGSEFSIGISYGKFYEFLPKQFVNPYIFLGFGTLDEYLVHFRVGINYGFQTNK